MGILDRIRGKSKENEQTQLEKQNVQDLVNDLYPKLARFWGISESETQGKIPHVFFLTKEDLDKDIKSGFIESGLRNIRAWYGPKYNGIFIQEKIMDEPSSGFEGWKAAIAEEVGHAVFDNQIKMNRPMVHHEFFGGISRLFFAEILPGTFKKEYGEYLHASAAFRYNLKELLEEKKSLTENFYKTYETEERIKIKEELDRVKIGIDHILQNCGDALYFYIGKLPEEERRKLATMDPREFHEDVIQKEGVKRLEEMREKMEERIPRAEYRDWKETYEKQFVKVAESLHPEEYMRGNTVEERKKTFEKLKKMMLEDFATRGLENVSTFFEKAEAGKITENKEAIAAAEAIGYKQEEMKFEEKKELEKQVQNLIKPKGEARERASSEAIGYKQEERKFEESNAYGKMEGDLKGLMVEFCQRFKLDYYEGNYSTKLTQREINALNGVGSGDLGKLLDSFGNDYSKIDEVVEKGLKGTSGMGIVEGMENLEKILNGNDKSNIKIIDYLAHNKELFMLLKGSREKIVNEKLVGTTPIPISEGVPGEQKLSMMIHESIHYILEKNKVDFSEGRGGLSPFDEGFCVFMHFRFNKHVDFYKNDNDTLTIKYRYWANFFENLLKNIPDDEIISTIGKYKTSDLQKIFESTVQETSGELSGKHTESAPFFEGVAAGELAKQGVNEIIKPEMLSGTLKGLENVGGFFQRAAAEIGKAAYGRVAEVVAAKLEQQEPATETGEEYPQEEQETEQFEQEPSEQEEYPEAEYQETQEQEQSQEEQYGPESEQTLPPTQINISIPDKVPKKIAKKLESMGIKLPKKMIKN